MYGKAQHKINANAYQSSKLKQKLVAEGIMTRLEKGKQSVKPAVDPSKSPTAPKTAAKVYNITNQPRKSSKLGTVAEEQYRLSKTPSMVKFQFLS